MSVTAKCFEPQLSAAKENSVPDISAFQPNLALDTTWLPGPNIDAFLDDITGIDLEPPRSPIRRPVSRTTSQPNIFEGQLEAGRSIFDSSPASPSSVSFDPFNSYLYIGDRQRRKAAGSGLNRSQSETI